LRKFIAHQIRRNRAINSFELNKAITTSKLFSKISLSPGSKLVLRCIVDFWNYEKGYAYPRQTTIAECTGLSKISISNIVAELKENQMIEIKKQGHRYQYYLTERFFKFISEDKDALTQNLRNFNFEDKHSLTPILKNNNKNIKNSLDKSVLETKELIKSYKQVKAASPYDNYACAVGWLNSLKVILPKNKFLQERAREVAKIWNLDINNLPELVKKENMED